MVGWPFGHQTFLRLDSGYGMLDKRMRKGTFFHPVSSIFFQIITLQLAAPRLAFCLHFSKISSIFSGVRLP
jgi:hypothetical protein